MTSPRETPLSDEEVKTWLAANLRRLLDDWFLDGDCLANRWWDYWTNPQAAFVKTIKERQERSPGTILK